ncbi:MAG: Gfo/Idh/MocA family oxidoreductase [Victivallaceae bacterium]|nr:Gfo/Idh/MocA family oxidoreductase [Victivallaceae bacterium]
MDTVRLGIIGMGGMGGYHAEQIQQGNVERCKLAAVCDSNKSALLEFGGGIKTFSDSRKLIRSGEVDAVLIATPHYAHTSIGIDALNNGLHVLVEKPISVHKADCERLISAHRSKKQVFAAMFNMRTDPHYQKVKNLIDDGQLGKLMRVNWIITDWFRTQAYFDSGGWRATWKGEGGGVLLNQCPHQLDLLQWMCGQPLKVRGFCGFGKRHKIEVEDEVTAYLEYKNDVTGVVVISTGEAPGTNRLEVVGELGKVVVENESITFIRNEVSAIKLCKTSKEGTAKPQVWNIDIPAVGSGSQHAGIIQNFVDAILDGVPLIAPAQEGIHSVELANAIVYSALLGKPVDLPLNAAAYERRLKELIRESTFTKKKDPTRKKLDIESSFNNKRER